MTYCGHWRSNISVGVALIYPHAHVRLFIRTQAFSRATTEHIPQVFWVWGKAVALLRYQLSHCFCSQLLSLGGTLFRWFPHCNSKLTYPAFIQETISTGACHNVAGGFMLQPFAQSVDAVVDPQGKTLAE